LINFQEEINGVIDELLEEEEMDITDINNLILDYSRSPHAYVNQRLQIQLELLMMSGVRSKHVEPLMNGGIINSVTMLHLVGCFYLIILRFTDP
jgi:hypothetical protein